MHTINPQAAEGLGLAPLTNGYHRDERWMLENVVRDMRRAGRTFVLVPDRAGNPEVWVAPSAQLEAR